jgi:ADP-ribose pyrophosphatase
MQQPQVLNRTVIYKDPWLNLYTDRVKFPDGHIVEKHHFLDFHKDAVGVLVTNPKQQLLLVKSYRYITRSIQWEIPAGMVEKGETILDAAHREVIEESGYNTKNISLIYTFYPMNGIANQVFHLMRAQTGEKIADFDSNEINSYGWFSKKRIEDMIKDRQIKDSLTLIGLLFYLDGR